jgi:hypothetical protein
MRTRLRPRGRALVVAGNRTLLICSSIPGLAWFNPFLLGSWVRLKIQEPPKSAKMETTEMLQE